MSAETVSVNTEFDTFAPRLVESSIVGTTWRVYKPIASVYQSDLDVLIPAEYDTYTDPNIHLYIRGKLNKADRSNMDD
jgi:hypothetical protein